MKKVQNSGFCGCSTVKVINLRRIDGTSLVYPDIKATVEKLNALQLPNDTFSVYTLYGFPEGTYPDQCVEEYLKVLDSCIAEPTEAARAELNAASRMLIEVFKMGNNVHIGAYGQRLADYWAKH